MQEAIVAGHICLDVIPSFGDDAAGMDQLLVPGALVSVGPAVTSTGGAVSNTGIALHRLGTAVGLVGKVGDDLFGKAVLDHLSGYSEDLAAGMVVAPDVHTSYTIVVSPPNIDRFFLHAPGANHTFCADDVGPNALRHARLFHFGYPPIMRRMYGDDGAELVKLFRRAKEQGMTTSLDMAYPDPAGEAARIDWGRLLERVLPLVDLFMPSLDEMLLMLDRGRHDRLQGEEAPLYHGIDTALLDGLARRLIGWGASVVGLKLGDQGFYLRTTDDPARLERAGAAAPASASWRGRQLLAPCYRADVVGTTGAGDCAIAGMLASVLRGLSPEKALAMAAAVGACSTEKPDATSGVPPWSEVAARLQEGWDRLEPVFDRKDWAWDESANVWRGPEDAGSS